MERKLKLGILILSVGVLAIGCKGISKKENTNTNEEMAEVIYTCPMHPEIEKHEPGNCPECGIDLVKKETDIEHMHE